jgi:dynein heavy chain
VIFIDDLNMPMVEEYGAQPPIELIRQLIDSGGWYDIKEKTWKTIIDSSVVAAMGPAGGGRNSVTPRLLRHFNLLCFVEFDDTTLRLIFSKIVASHFEMFNGSGNIDVRGAVDSVVDATLDTYRAAMAVLLPTPQKSHYTFNLRDFSRIIQGVLLHHPTDSFNKSSLARLWAHEALRVLGDRLVDDSDRLWFHRHIETMCATRFSSPFYETFKYLDTKMTKTITMEDMRHLIYGDYMDGSDGKYDEVRNMHDLQEKMDEYLADYNASCRKPTDLVLFSFAIEHISRVCRILKMPGGNALLVGVGGSGRQSVTRLAAHISGHDLFQIEISKSYSNSEWREDLKTVLKRAGTESSPLTFLFSDTQIKNEVFVEDINNMLNSGEVPNIFANDERVAISELVRPFARQRFGKVAQDMTIQDLYAYFIQRVRQNLHIILVFSPIGDAFRDRLRKFPALVNCCTIDWFTAWPEDALVAVAQKFLMDVKLEFPEMRQAIVQLCQQFHFDARDLSDEFYHNLKRYNYVTPTSYLELIIAYKENLRLKRVEVHQEKMRYEGGLEKLAYAAEQVNHMQNVLNNLEPELIKAAAKAEDLMSVIAKHKPVVKAKEEAQELETKAAMADAAIVEQQRTEVQRDVDEAQPLMDAALDALDTIDPADINEIKSMRNPPEIIQTVLKAICIMFGREAKREIDPNNPAKRRMNYWPTSQALISDTGFVDSLRNFPKDNMDPKMVREIQRDFIDNKELKFTRDRARNASKSAEGMFMWVDAMIKYDAIAKIMAPKKAALEEAEKLYKGKYSSLD